MAKANLFGGAKDSGLQFCERCGKFAAVIVRTKDAEGKEVRAGLCCSGKIDEERRAAEAEQGDET